MLNDDRNPTPPRIRPGRRWLVAVGLGTALLLTGCATRSLLRQADIRMARNDPGMAVYFFSEALKRDPKLSHDPEFVLRYRQARLSAAMHEGRGAAKIGDWDLAVRCFERALEIEPGDIAARTSLDAVRSDGANKTYARAVQAADNGDRTLASSLLETARGYDSTNSDVAAALRFSQPGRLPQGEPSTARYAEAFEKMRAKRWQEAQIILAKVVADTPQHILARAQLHDVVAKLAEAKGLCAQGVADVAVRRLWRAEQRLTAALEIWPFFDTASSALRDVGKRIEQAEVDVAKARELAASGEWDAALAQAVSASDLAADYTEAHALQGEIKGRAAAAYQESGQRLLAQGKLSEAEAEFRTCLRYVADMAAARRGLASVAGRRAESYAGEELWGNALVWYWHAQQRFADKQYQEGVAAMTQRIAARLASRVDVVVDAEDVLRSSAEGFADALAKRLSDKRPRFLDIRLVNEPAGDAAYVAGIGLRFCEVEHDVVRSVNKAHDFTEYREEPNPKLPRIGRRIGSVQGDLRRLRHDYDRECRDCRGRGTVECSRCRGSGSQACAPCGGTGTVEVDGERRTCEQCRGRGHLPCKHCDGKPVRCSHCRGSGRDSRVTLSDIHWKENELRQLEREYRDEPETVLVGYPARWPYTEITHLKAGRGRAVLDLRLNGGKTVFQDTFDAVIEHRDSMIENPNAEIGLAPDALELPVDRDVRDRVLARLAADAAESVVREALKSLGRTVSAEAAKVNGDARVEALADRYLLLLHLDGAEAKRAREALMKMPR